MRSGRRRIGVSLGAAVLTVGLSVAVASGPAGATDVSDEAGLRAAFDTDSQIDLLGDVTLADCGEGDLDRSASTPVTVDGHGFTITQTCSDNILEPGSDVTLQNVTLTGGRERDDGGAIDMNGGDLTVIDSTIAGNCAADSAGAIENEDGDTTIIGSTLTDNFAFDQAGAFRSKRGNTVIVNSTVTGNSQAFAAAVDSGQIDAITASLTLVYDTIVDNTVNPNLTCAIGGAPTSESGDDDGGDAQVEGTASPANVNAVDDFFSFGTVVALPNGGSNCANATAPGGSYNFSDDSSCNFSGTGDREDAGDPLLGELADNGGPTHTRLPLTGSPLIDAVPLDACGDGDAAAGFAVTTDQRGVARPQDEGCEVGAVELEAIPPPPPPPAEPTAATPAFTG